MTECNLFYYTKHQMEKQLSYTAVTQNNNHEDDKVGR